MAKATFKIAILNAKKLVYSGEAERVQLVGDISEYELMPYHSPVLGVLKRGNIVINGVLAIPIERGLVKFIDNECVILAEEKNLIDIGSDMEM